MKVTVELYFACPIGIVISTQPESGEIDDWVRRLPRGSVKGRRAVTPLFRTASRYACSAVCFSNRAFRFKRCTHGKSSSTNIIHIDTFRTGLPIVRDKFVVEPIPESIDDR